MTALLLLADNKLYWCDARLDYVASMNVDGSERRTLITVTSQDVHFFDVILAHDELLVSEWVHK